MSQVSKTRPKQALQEIHEMEETLDSPDELVTIQSRGNRPAQHLSRRGIFRLAAKGLSQTDIADMFGVSIECLMSHFKTEFAMGKANMKAGLKAQVIREALRDKPQPAILIFAAKSFAGMTDSGTNDQGEPTPDSKSISVNLNVITKPGV